MEPVDLALCLAVDVSASVDYDEYGLMLGGYAAAFRDPAIVALCVSGPRRAVAVGAVFWSGFALPFGPVSDVVAVVLVVVGRPALR